MIQFYKHPFRVFTYIQYMSCKKMEEKLYIVLVLQVIA